jgi:hypothetical protein
MIDELVKCGISENTVNYIKEIDFLKYDFEINIENCINVINYLKSININNIDDLILNSPDFFFKEKKDVEDLFNKKDINKMVNLINEDCYNIDLLYN